MKSEKKISIIVLVITIVFSAVLMKVTVFNKSNKESVTESTIPTTLFNNENKYTADRLFYLFGFTDDNKRVEIKPDTSDGLNSDKVKNYIYDRMSNSIDYFNTIQAVYFHSALDTNDYYSAYCISHNVITKSKEIILNQKGEITDYFAYNGKKSAEIFCDGEVVIQDGINYANADILPDIINLQNKPLAEKLSVNTLINYEFVDYEEKRDNDYVRLIASKKRERYEDGLK